MSDLRFCRIEASSGNRLFSLMLLDQSFDTKTLNYLH